MDTQIFEKLSKLRKDIRDDVQQYLMDWKDETSHAELDYAEEIDISSMKTGKLDPKKAYLHTGCIDLLDCENNLINLFMFSSKELQYLMTLIKAAAESIIRRAGEDYLEESKIKIPVFPVEDEDNKEE